MAVRPRQPRTDARRGTWPPWSAGKRQPSLQRRTAGASEMCASPGPCRRPFLRRPAAERRSSSCTSSSCSTGWARRTRPSWPSCCRRTSAPECTKRSKCAKFATTASLPLNRLGPRRTRLAESRFAAPSSPLKSDASIARQARRPPRPRASVVGVSPERRLRPSKRAASSKRRRRNVRCGASWKSLHQKFRPPRAQAVTGEPHMVLQVLFRCHRLRLHQVCRRIRC
mmetsp:Transcript_10663/g.30213  ORF Transcript_10663/g.30213 Transcript_10663/m.30213 type:complete len:226 (-) Transcript_10663:1351-2028(-)